MKTFVKWWLCFMLILVGSFFAYNLDVFAQIYTDCHWIGSFICFLTMGLFSYITLWCGVKTWRFCRWKTEYYESHKDEFHRLEDVGWFSSDICQTFGIIGTVAGMIIMLEAFKSVDLANSKSVQELIVTVGTGMSTAFYTTLVGLICSVLLKFQYFNLGQAIESREVEDEKT